jgi:hypothetical protein
MKSINHKTHFSLSSNSLIIKAWAVLLTVVMTTSCKPVPTDQEIKSVPFRQGDIRDQNNAAICWAYALTAWVEWYALSKHNLRLDLSEEALVYFAIAEKLFKSAQDRSGKAARAFNSEIEYGDSRTGLGVIAKYGMIPEEFYGNKFRGLNDDIVYRNIERDFPSFLKGRRSPPTMEDIFTFLEDPEHLGPRPRNSFRTATHSGNNEEVTRLDLLHKIIGFPYSERNTTDIFGNLSGGFSGGIENVVKILKKSLARGIPVLLSFSPDDGNIYGNQDNYVFDFQAPNKQIVDGSHVVMVVDFVNKGGKIGRIAPNELQFEVEKSPEELSFVLAKNSWGRYSSERMAKKLEGRDFLDLEGASPGQIAITWRFLLANKDSVHITVADEILNSN